MAVEAGPPARTEIGGIRRWVNRAHKSKVGILTISFSDIGCYLSYVDTRPAVRGLGGAFVNVEPLDPEIEKSGLTQSQIQSDTELRLKSAGINVLTKEQYLQLKGHPYLFVSANISMLRTQITRYLFYIRIQLNQEVVLVRAPDTKVTTVTWSAGGWGIDFSLDNIRQTGKTQVDRFVNAYLAENRH